MPLFIKNINTWTSWKGLKTMMHLHQRAQCVPAKFFGICSSKIIPDHWLIDLFWPSIKSFHSPPYCDIYLIWLGTEAALAVWPKQMIRVQPSRSSAIVFLGRAATATRILSPKPMRRPLSCLLIKFSSMHQTAEIKRWIRMSSFSCIILVY